MTESGPLKRTIPLDLQRQVEDIQKKVQKTAGPPGDLDDRKKRWLVVGICLHAVISPVLRTYVVSVVTKLCYYLTSRNKIHKQTYANYLKRYNPTNIELNYETINNNKALFGRNRFRYDYRVKSPVDLSRLFLRTHMAHFTAFDESCDSSALLGIIENIDKFPTNVQYYAKQIRSIIRNPWAHCDFREWDAIKYADSFQWMEQLVKHLCLSNREENRILGKLNRWATNGQNFFNGTRLGLEIVEEIRQQTHVLSEYVQTLCSETDSQIIRVQKELSNLENDLQEHEERIKSLESKYEKHDEKIDTNSSLTTSVSREMEVLKNEVKRQKEDHIPKNIRAQHYQVILEWENDEASFVETRAANYILTSVASNDCIIVTGSSGCGKSSNIHHVALHLRKKYGYEIIPVLTGPSDIINYKHENTPQVFVVDDICGKETINKQTLQMWRDYSENMEKIFKTVKNEERNQNNDKVSNITRSKLLISCRLHIYKESQFQLDNFLTRKECNVLSPELCLLQEEKIQMAKIYHLDNMIDKVMKVEENIYFFPLLCKLSKDKKSEEVLNLFTAPVDSIRTNIKHIVLESDMQYCALVLCVLYDDGFDTDWLKLQFILETEKRNKLEDIVKEFDIDLSREKSRKTLKLAFDTLDGTYLRQRGTEYRMIHDMIYKLAAVICGQKLTECFIKHAPSVIIRDHFIFNSVTDAPENDDVIMLSGDEEDEYFKRLLNDLKESIIISTFHNKQLKYNAFREKLIRTFGRSNEAKQTLKDFDPNGYKMKRDEYFMDWYYSLTTPLMQSVSDGYYDVVHFLIETVKCNVNIRDQLCRSLLYKASEGGKIDVVQLLLQNNTDMSNCQTYGSCPLYVACEKGYTDIVNILLQNYAPVSQCRSYGLFLVECVNGHTSNTFTENSRFCSSLCRSNRFRSSPNRNPRGRDNFCNCQQGQARESPLYVACKRGHIDIVTLLLQNKADVSLFNRLGETPLYTACEGGHKDIVKMLLQKNAAVSQLGIFNKSSLHSAYNGGHKDIMELLLLNNDVSYDFNEFEIFLALKMACEQGHTKLVELLLKKKVDVNLCDNNVKRSLLYIVCSRGHASIVNMLLKNKADISQCNSDGESPLYAACANGHKDIVEILMQNQANVSQCNSNGNTPLQAAIANGHTDIVNILQLN